MPRNANADTNAKAAAGPAHDFSSLKPDETGLIYLPYSVDQETRYLPSIRALISNDLSEPYSIYVYRYFLNQWPHLCFMGLDPKPPHDLHAVIVSKLEPHPPPHHPSYNPAEPQPQTLRGYIAMLAVDATHRRRGIASRLICTAIDSMRDLQADEVVLETEISNTASLKLYERLGFIRTKRLHRYYLNGNTAYRLGLFLREGAGTRIMGGSIMSPYEMELAPRPAAGRDEEDAAGRESGGGGLSMRFPDGQIA